MLKLSTTYNINSIDDLINLRVSLQEDNMRYIYKNEIYTITNKKDISKNIDIYWEDVCLIDETNQIYSRGSFDWGGTDCKCKIQTISMTYEEYLDLKEMPQPEEGKDRVIIMIVNENGMVENIKMNIPLANYFYLENPKSLSNNAVFSYTPSKFTYLEGSCDNGLTWQEINGDYALSPGIKMYLRGHITGKQIAIGSGNIDYAKFNIPELLVIGGNINSLFAYNDFEDITEIPYANCFTRLFEDCNIVARDLIMPCITLKESCYSYMFRGTNILIPELMSSWYLLGDLSVPQLPSTELVSTCYEGMFTNCEICHFPNLNATTMAPYCYMSMFGNSYFYTYNELVNELGQISVYNYFGSEQDYKDSFYMPACTLNEGCFQYMFSNSNIFYLKTDMTEYSSSAFETWMYDVNTTGAMDKPKTLKLPRGYNGIPENWLDINDPPTPPEPEPTPEPEEEMVNQYMTFEMVEDSVVSFKNTGLYTTLQYNVLGTSQWVDISNNQSLSFAAGLTVFLRGVRSSTNGYSGGSAKLNLMIGGSGKYNLKGNLMSIYNYNDFRENKTIATRYCFYFIFESNTAIYDTSNFVMPATTISEGCYGYFFRGCTSMIKTPKVIPALHIPYLACAAVFGRCYNITEGPVFNCTSVENLAFGHYDNYMGCFQSCTSLQKAPVLKPATLYDNSYGNLFRDCTSLTEITVWATDFTSTSFSSWVRGITRTDGIIKCKSRSLPSGVDGIPNGWTIQYI